MPFRARKKITIIPGILDLNLSGSASRGKGATGGHSFTWRLGRRVSYNTRDGKTRVNTPGLGWWESSTRSQRNRRRMKQAAQGSPPASRPTRSAKSKADPDAAAWAAHFAEMNAAGGREAAINSARAAGRCPGHGQVIPPGGMCPQCAEEGAQRHAAADRGGAPGRSPGRSGRPAPVIDTHSGSFTIAPDPGNPKGGMYVWAGRPGSRAIKGPFPDGVAANRWVDDNMLEVVRAARIETAPQDSYRPGDPYRDDVLAGRMSMVGAERRRWLGEEEAERLEKRERTERQWQRTELERQGGTCGAQTQDGTPCRNGAGCAIPAHRRKRPAGARQ